MRAAPSRLLAAQRRQRDAHLGQTGRLGPVEDADAFVVRAVDAVDVGRRRSSSSGRRSTNFGRGRVDREVRGNFRCCPARAQPCAAGRPEQQSWARRAPGAAVDDGSGRWSRPPGAHQIVAKRSGRVPPPKVSTTRTSRITTVTPRRPTFALRKNPNQEPLSQLVDGGEMPQRRPRRHFSCGARLYPQRSAESSAPLDALFTGPDCASAGAAPPPPVGTTDRDLHPEAGRDAL